jgi:hypothetical protein
MFRALLVVLLALTQIIAPQASKIAGFGTPIASVGGSSSPGPEQPSGYTFAIWGLIFALALLFAVRQLLASRRDAALYQTVGTAAVVLFGASTAWMLVAQFHGNGLVLVGLIWLMLLAAARGFFRTHAMRAGLDAFDRYVTLPMFALYMGWLAAAAWLNTGSVLKLYSGVASGLTPALYAAALLVLIAILSLLLLRRAQGYLPLGLTTIWALAGVAHANISLRPNTQVATLAISLALLVVGYLLWQRRPAVKSEF